MKAAVVTQYGSPDAVHIEDVAEPVPRDDEVLIRVRAASLNPLDWHLMHGTPRVTRLVMGLRRPKISRPGIDVAGTVESIDQNVTQFKPGDDVFGCCRGAFAEYACTVATKLARKPADITFEQAAALPIAGLTALQALRDKAHVQPLQNVLINGASGGVGTFAIQIAKIIGAHVTAVCSARNADLVCSLGAEHVIDYTRDDFTNSSEHYDVLFDLAATHSLSACRRVLTADGTYVCAGVLGASVLTLPARSLASAVLGPFIRQKFITLFASQKQADLDTLAHLVSERKLVAVIDRRFPLSEIADAVRYLAQKHARGKVIVTVAA